MYTFGILGLNPLYRWYTLHFIFEHLLESTNHLKFFLTFLVIHPIVCALQSSHLPTLFCMRFMTGWFHRSISFLSGLENYFLLRRFRTIIPVASKSRPPAMMYAFTSPALRSTIRYGIFAGIAKRPCCLAVNATGQEIEAKGDTVVQVTTPGQNHRPANNASATSLTILFNRLPQWCLHENIAFCLILVVPLT